jgi:hypothetical protein
MLRETWEHELQHGEDLCGGAQGRNGVQYLLLMRFLGTAHVSDILLFLH